MEFVIKISQFLLSLSLLIVLHELGHFIPAKLFKTKVEKFYLFFDVKFSLFKKKIGETEYGIGWLPLGGYVKIAGMIDESMDKEQMAQPPKPWEFRSKPAWQRLIIMLGGVTVNFILAYVIFVFMSFFYGDADVKVDSLKDGYLIENPVLLESGFRTGDKVLAINGTKIINDSDIGLNIIGAERITIERNGQTETVDLPEDFLGRLSSSGSKQLFEYRYPFLVSSVSDSSHNKGVDLKEGDQVIAVNGEGVEYIDEIETRLLNFKNQTVTLGVLRNNDTISRTLKVNEQGKIGIFRLLDPAKFAEMGYFEVTRKEYSFFESFGAGGRKFSKTLSNYGDQLKAIFNPSTGAYKGLGGFKAIYDQFSPVWSWSYFGGLQHFYPSCWQF